MSYGHSDHHQFLKHLVVVCGTQKGGTSSLMKTLRRERKFELYAYMGETHYFDSFDHNVNPHALDTMDSATRYYYANTGATTGYINRITNIGFLCWNTVWNQLSVSLFLC